MIGKNLCFLMILLGSNCFDGLQNHGETGIDCGGKCEPCVTESCVGEMCDHRKLSESQDFIVPNDAIAGEDVGIVKTYPEFTVLGNAPRFTLAGGPDNVYEISEKGHIRVVDPVLMDPIKDELTVKITKDGFSDTFINVTVNLIESSRCVYVDGNAEDDGIGTRPSPKNTAPAIVSDNDCILFKRGSTTTVTTAVGPSGQSNILIASYGSGDLPVVQSNVSRVFTTGRGSDGLTIRDLEITTADPTAVVSGNGSNWQMAFYAYAYGGAWKNVRFIHNSLHHNSGIAMLSTDTRAENASVDWNTLNYISNDGIFTQNIGNRSPEHLKKRHYPDV